MRVAQFFRLYQKPFGVFSSAYLTAATTAFLWCRCTGKWTIDTAYTPHMVIECMLKGDVFSLLKYMTGFPLDTTRSNILHFIANVAILLPGLSQFEKMFGTLHTFFFLGLITPVIGVLFAMLGVLWCPLTYIFGIHSWNFIIWGYFIAQESKLGATVKVVPKRQWRIPVSWVPLLILVSVGFMTTIVVFPLVICLLMGYSLPLVKRLFDYLLPPTALINYIEEKLFGSNKTGTYCHIRYYREVYVKKGKKYKSIFAESSSSSGLPKTKKSGNKNKAKLKSKNKK